MPDYAALKLEWQSAQGSTVKDKLAFLNSQELPKPNPDPIVEKTTITWAEANGWIGPINQNDLVAAGIITDAERKKYEEAL